MKKYEYRVDDIRIDGSLHRVNEIANEGWRLVAVVGTRTYFFERDRADGDA